MTELAKNACGGGCHCGSKCRCVACSCGRNARFFDALGNHTRMRILAVLRGGSLSVTEIIEMTGIEQTSTSHNLRLLERERLVTVRRDGKRRVYALRDDVGEMIALAEAHISAASGSQTHVQMRRRVRT